QNFLSPPRPATSACYGKPGLTPSAAKAARSAWGTPRAPSFHLLPSLDLILQGSEWLARGRASEALHCAEEALRQDPHDADALFLLGAAHYRDGDLAAAEARLKQAIQANDKVAVFHSTLGNAGLALRIGRRALEQDANNPRVMALLAAALRQEGSLEEAIGCAQRAVDLRPADGRSREQLGSLLLKAGSAQSALPHLEECVRLQPRSPQALLALAEAHMALGDREQASQLAQRSSALEPKDATLWVRLGELLSKQGLAAQAELAFRRA